MKGGYKSTMDTWKPSVIESWTNKIKTKRKLGVDKNPYYLSEYLSGDVLMDDFHVAKNDFLRSRGS